MFWRTLRAGAYDQIPRAIELLKAAYLQNPRDAETAAHVGFLHAWRLAERSRLVHVPPGIVDDATLARTFFDRAIERGSASLDVVDGFAAVFQMAEGEINGDDKLSAAGLARGRAAVRRWPEFNGFTLGYALSSRSDTSALFREAVDLQWMVMEACRQGPVDRAEPTAASALVLAAAARDDRKRRACLNSAIAPHNVEGFFLNFGDMLVKAGDWRTARRIYALARSAPSFDKWPYRLLLEARIADAQRNVSALRAPDAHGSAARAVDPTRRIMIRTPFACTGCHEARADRQ